MINAEVLMRSPNTHDIRVDLYQITKDETGISLYKSLFTKLFKKNTMKIWPTLLLTLNVLIAGCVNKSGKREETSTNQLKPNIIYILADDLGYGDLGCYGSTKIKTPRLNRLAAEGIRFTNHYSGQTVCSPSRCALMTGMHMGHASVKANGQLLDPDDLTVAELLKSAGYITGIIGKWGLAKGPHAPNSPNQQGFDHWFGFDNQGFAHFYYPEFLWRNKEKVAYPENVEIRDKDGYYLEGKGTYIHDEFTKEALWFIKENQDQPFFLYLPYAVPHAELTVPKESFAPYEALSWPETPKTKPGYDNSNMKDQGYGSQYTTGYCAQQQPNATYAAMITRMDRDIGQIIDLLDELGIAENTIVMFGSDNGPSNEGGQNLDFFASSGGLRGKKGTLYEGGVRTPFIVRWKGKIKEGIESGLISHFSDFLPTACDIAGIPPQKKIDGISMWPILLGESGQQHKYLYWEWKGIQALRVGKWKFFYMNADNPDQKPIYELYNLNEDKAEQNNVAADHPEQIEEFLQYLKVAKE